MRSLIVNPLLPWPALAAVAAALILAVALGYLPVRRRGGRALVLLGLRLAALALLLVFLVQPQKRGEETSWLRARVAVLVDVSESMTDKADPSQPTRAERVAAWLRSPLAREVAEKFDTRWFVFDGMVSEVGGPPADLRFEGKRSNPWGALARVTELCQGQPLAGILLFTDGLAGAGETEATAMGTRVAVFETEKPFDAAGRAARVAIQGIEYPRKLGVGREGEVRVTLAATGATGRGLDVELWREGAKLASRAVVFSGDGTRDAVFPVSHATAGTVSYEVRVPNVPPDARSLAEPLLVTVTEQSTRVVYLQNSLSFEMKFLKKALVGDRNLQLSVFVRWPDGRLVSLSGGGAAAAAESFGPAMLAGTAALVLGDLLPETLASPAFAGVPEFVNRGGGLVVLGGPNGLASATLQKTALAKILPVLAPQGATWQEGSFPVETTDVGLHHPVFGPLFAKASDFPPLLSLNAASGVTPAAEVLMQTRVGARAIPLVVAARSGKGKVVVLLTDSIWRWRLAARGWSGEHTPYETFWSQLMEWLVSEPIPRGATTRMELVAEPQTSTFGEKVELRASLDLPPNVPAPSSVAVSVHAPDGRKLNFSLRAIEPMRPGGSRVWRAEFEPHVPGLWRAESLAEAGSQALKAETRFVVSVPAAEITGRPIDRAALKQLAASTGGTFYPVEKWESWSHDFRTEEQCVTRTRLTDLWNHPVLVILFFSLLVAEWTIRRRANWP